MSTVEAITRTKNFKKMIVALFLFISLLFWLSIWVYGKFYASTDDAYVNANIVQIAPRVTGKIDHLLVANNQYVKKGQLLFTLDEEPFQIAIDSAKGQVDVNAAQLFKATVTAKRTFELVKTKYLSPQEGDNAAANVKAMTGGLQYAQAMLTQAVLNLKYTKIIAPTSGWITNLSLREGDIVMANQPLFALVGDEEFWVDANFKETELEPIKPRQKATIVADMYPDHPFQGVVESISDDAGAAFSLLPPQNATGNWVKVTQRVPVRIRVLNPDKNYPLRVGTSVSVKITL